MSSIITLYFQIVLLHLTLTTFPRDIADLVPTKYSSKESMIEAKDYGNIWDALHASSNLESAYCSLIGRPPPHACFSLVDFAEGAGHVWAG